MGLQNLPFSGLKIVDIYEGDQRDLTKKLIELDKECFEGIQDADEGTLDQWISIRTACVGSVLFQEDKLVGYIDFVVINQEGITSLKKGTIQDGNLKNIVGDVIPHSSVSLYLVCIALKSHYRGKGIASLLWNSVRERLRERNIKVNEVYATVWTSEGDAFLKKLGFSKLSRDDSGHPIVHILTHEDGLLPKVRV